MLPRQIARLVGALALVPLSLVPLAAVGTTPHHGYLVLAATEYSTGTTPYAVVTADFNSDGFDDWATANIGGNSITVMLSDGLGGFVAAPGSPISVSGASKLRTGFVDAGTVPDLVVVKDATSNNPDSLATLLGTGNGGFGAPVAGPSLGAQVSAIQVGDVTGDQVLDVVSARIQVDASTHTYPVTVWAGNGAGAFAAVTTVTEGAPLSNDFIYGGPQTIELGNMDGDTDLDVLVPNVATSDVSVWLNNGSGVLTGATGSPFAAGARPQDLTLADIDTDGDLDALATDPNQPDGSVRVLLGDGSGGLTPTTPLPTPGMPVYFLERTDFNNDGIADLVAMSNNYLSGGADGRFMTFLGDGAGGFALGWGYGTFTLTKPNALAAGDFTGDGLADLAVTNNATSKVRIYLTVIDDTAPVTTVDLTPPDLPPSGWYTTNVQVSWSIVETGSGWANVRCTVDPWAVPASYDALPGSFCVNQLLTSDGTHQYYVAAIDRAGNKESVKSATIPIDKTAPSVSISSIASQSAPGWYDAPLSATVSANDFGISGVAELRCLADPDPVPVGFADLPAGCATPFDLGEGQHTVYAAATDNAGNTTTVQSHAFDIDTTAPTVSPSVTPSTFETGTEPTVDAGALDSLSGIDADVTTCDPVDQTVGDHVMHCSATDNASNQAGGQTTYTVLPHPDATVTLASARAAGTRVSLQATVSTNAELNVATLTIHVPPTLRPDSATAGCAINGLTVTCPMGTLPTDTSKQVTVLASPRTAGPHDWNASFELQDSNPGNNSIGASVGTDVVCDNVPTSAADAVTGTSGADILCGLGGNDTFRGLAGNDLIFGGNGTDLISYVSATATAVDLRQQGLGLVGAMARSGTGHGKDSFTGIEHVLGSAFADLLTGDGSANRLLGGDGNDVLRGLGGPDRLEGGAGADRLTGGASRDTLVGGAGRDTCRESADARVSCEL